MNIFHTFSFLLCFAVSPSRQNENYGTPLQRTACGYAEVVLSAKQPPSPSKGWFKDDSPTPMEHTSRKIISPSTNDLIFRPVHVFDAGRYTFQDINNGIRENCTVYILSVTDTRLEAIETNVNSPEHSRVFLKVKAMHHGKPQWYFNDELLPTGTQSRHFHYAKARRFGLHYGSVLEIRDIRKRHQGKYKLVWTTPNGCQSNLEIDVNVTPQKTNGKANTTNTINIYKPKQVLKAIITGEAKGGWRKLLKNKKKVFLLILSTLAGIVVIASLITCVAYVWYRRKMSKDSKRQKGLSGKYEPLPTIDEENVIGGGGNNNNPVKTNNQQPTTTNSQQPETNPFLMTSSDDTTTDQSTPPPGKYLVSP